MSPPEQTPDVSQFQQLQRIRSGELSFDDARIRCRACTARGHCQLGVRVTRDDAIDGVSGTVLLPDWCEGGPRTAHGGMVAAVLEEVLGLVHTSTGVLAVTVHLSTTFHRPVPVGQPLRVQARLTETHPDGRRLAVATLATDRLLAEGAGEFKARDPARHFRWAQGQYHATEQPDRTKEN